MTNNSRSSTNGSKDAISLLKEDHKIVQDLLQKLLTSTRSSKPKEALLENIEREIKTHSLVEEEIFYPAFKESVSKQDDEKLFFEAREEHHVVDLVLEEFDGSQDSDAFAAKCKVLKELVEHHIKEEEKEMFPLAKKVMKKEMLKDLAERIEVRKAELQSGMES